MQVNTPSQSCTVCIEDKTSPKISVILHFDKLWMLTNFTLSDQHWIQKSTNCFEFPAKNRLTTQKTIKLALFAELTLQVPTNYIQQLINNIFLRIVISTVFFLRVNAFANLVELLLARV